MRYKYELNLRRRTYGIQHVREYRNTIRDRSDESNENLEIDDTINSRSNVNV